MKNAVLITSWSLKRSPAFVFRVFNVLLMLLLTHSTNAQYLVEILERAQLGGHRPVVRCDATGANFGDDVITFSFGLSAVGCALPTEPADACSNITTKPELNMTAHCFFEFAVVPRGNCTFSEKAFRVQNAQPSGYAALILYTAKGQSPIPMSGSKFADKVNIPVVMVNYACMQSLLYGHYTSRHGYLVTLKASPGYYDLVKYLVPFVAIVGICFVVLFISLMIRLCRERRRQARKRLPRSHLKKIPTKKYKKGDPEETCAICLEDFQEAEKLRVLPCRHAYHCKCIDPWLTKNRKVCPVCKRRVGPRNRSDSSDTDDTTDAERTTTNARNGANSNAGGVAFATTSSAGGGNLFSHRDNDPLLSNAQPMGGATTSSSAECPYPHQHASNSLSRSIAGSVSAPFIRATNFVHLGNIFHRRAMAPPPSVVVDSLSGAQSSSRRRHNADNNDAASVDNSNNNNNGTHPQQAETLSVNNQMSSALEDLTNVGIVVQPLSLPLRPSTSPASTSPLQFVRSNLVGMRDKLTHLIRHHHQSGGGPSMPPHTLLENEEDNASSTTLLSSSSSGGRPGADDTISNRTCDTFDDSATNGGAGSASIDGHSMTTVHSSSRNHLVPSAATTAVVVVDLSSSSAAAETHHQQQ